MLCGVKPAVRVQSTLKPPMRDDKSVKPDVDSVVQRSRDARIPRRARACKSGLSNSSSGSLAATFCSSSSIPMSTLSVAAATKLMSRAARRPGLSHQPWRRCDLSWPRTISRLSDHRPALEAAQRRASVREKFGTKRDLNLGGFWHRHDAPPAAHGDLDRRLERSPPSASPCAARSPTMAWR